MRERKKSQNRMKEQQQETMGEEGYQYPGGMAAFPGLAAVTTEFTGVLHGMYDRRPWMLMPLPGLVGVPFFRG